MFVHEEVKVMKSHNAYAFVERTFLDATSDATPPLSWWQRLGYSYLLRKAKAAIERQTERIEAQFGDEEVRRRLIVGNVKVMIKVMGMFVHCQKMYPDIDRLDSQNRDSELYVYIVFGHKPEWDGCCRSCFDKFISDCFAKARGVKRSGEYAELKMPMPEEIVFE